MNDRGFASPVLLSLLALAGLTCLAAGDAGAVLVASLRAHETADGAALAAAADQWGLNGSFDPSGAASRIAAADAATVDACDCAVRGSSATVTVSVPVHLRLLQVGPSVVHAMAIAKADPGALFRPSGG